MSKSCKNKQVGRSSDLTTSSHSTTATRLGLSATGRNGSKQAPRRPKRRYPEQQRGASSTDQGNSECTVEANDARRKVLASMGLTEVDVDGYSALGTLWASDRQNTHLLPNAIPCGSRCVPIAPYI